MSDMRSELDAALRAAIAGRIDELRPEHVEALARALDERPQLADELARSRPREDDPLVRAYASTGGVEGPTAAAWSDVWGRIERQRASVAAASGPRALAWQRWTARWRPLTAAAACVAIAVGWWFMSRGERGDAPAVESWPMQIATDVVIENLEVLDGGTPFIVSVGAESADIIWVLPAEV